MKKNILFVNLEKQLISDLMEIFSAEEYSIYTADTGLAGINILEQNKINLLVAGITIPDTDGIALLKKARQQYPLTLRIAVTDKSNNSLIFKLFNNSLCKYCLEKPLIKYELAKSINHLFTMEDKLSSKELLSTINSLDKLPVLPDTYIKVNQMIDDDEDIEDIAEVINSDATLSLKILQIANSAFYRVKTGSINTAISTLGFINIKNIILTVGLFDFFDNNTHKKKLLWKHALATNKIVLGIYRNLLKKELSNFYSSAGMLHDIGKIIMLKNYPENYMKIFDLVQKRKISFTEAELEVLNSCNAEVGAYLLDWWGIPTPIVEAALFHETPFNSSAENRELVSVVHIASFYAWFQQNIVTGEQIDERIFSDLGLTKEECENISRKVINEIGL